MLYIMLLAGTVFLAFAVLISVLENRKLEIGTYQIENEKLPDSFDNCTFLMLSDLHGVNKKKQIIQAVDQRKPDYILVGGDMIVASSTPDYRIATELLQELAEKYPVFYALGNHEQKCKNKNFSDYQKQLEKLGVLFLDNKQIFLNRNGQEICLAGLSLEMDYYAKWKTVTLSAAHIKELIGIPKEGSFTILLAHHPAFFPAYTTWGADLTLSGHLHGGMVRLPKIGGIVSPQIRLFPKYSDGKYQREKSELIVSRGLGAHTIKLRMFNLPELVEIRLKK